MFTKRQSGEPGVYWVLYPSGNCWQGRSVRMGAEDTLDALREHALIFLRHIVLFYRIFLIMYMVLNLANAETCHLCRIHNSENGLTLSEDKAYFCSQRLFSLLTPETLPENQHRCTIQREQRNK